MTLCLGLLLNVLGFSGLWAASTFRIAPLYWEIVGFSVLASLAGYFTDTAAIATNLKNFPHERGAVVGTAPSLFISTMRRILCLRVRSLTSISASSFRLAQIFPGAVSWAVRGDLHRGAVHRRHLLPPGAGAAAAGGGSAGHALHQSGAVGRGIRDRHGGAPQQNRSGVESCTCWSLACVRDVISGDCERVIITDWPSAVVPQGLASCGATRSSWLWLCT